MTTLCMYPIYLSASDLLSFIISNTDKDEFSCIWKWISCCNDVMNHANYIIKRDAYLQEMLSCSKNICGISVFVLRISLIYQKNISWVVLHGYSHGWKIKLYTVFGFYFIYELCYVKRGLNAFAKSINSCQSVKSVQANMS